MTIQRFDYGALYFYKRHWRFGANFRDLNDGERRALQSNKGVSVVSIVDGSPAYKSDILAGDVIVAVDGQPVFGQQAFADLMQQKAGHTVEVTIVRGEKTLKQPVPLEQ